MARKKKVETTKESVEIISNDIAVISNIDLNFKGLKFRAGEKYNFTKEAFEEIKKTHSTLEVFIKRGTVKID